MIKGATARRYAQAVFDIAVEQRQLDRWRDDVRTLAEYLGNRRLLFVLSEPKIPFERKELILRDLLAVKIQPDALGLAKLLVERGIAELAPRISQHFESLYNTYRGQAVAQITTAIPLDDDLRAQIAGELQTLTGKRILLQERVDPAILGGAVARVGDTLIDGSLRRRFTLLRQQIAAGTLGGPEDDTGFVIAPISPDDGSGGGSAPPTPESGPSSAGSGPVSGASGQPGGGSSQATSATSQPSGAPHMAPRPQQGGGPGRGGSGGTTHVSGGRNYAPRRRRRR